MTFRAHVLAVAPIYRGLGFIVLDLEGGLLDWGTTDTRRHNAPASIKRAHKMLQRYAPETLVLELVGSPTCRRKQAARELITEIALLGKEFGCSVAFYDRGEVWRCLRLEGRETKASMARAVAERLPVLARRVPKPRKIWESEKQSMSIFVAAGLALAHLSER